MRTVDPARYAARRASIQQAAAGVFAERGYAGATTVEICRRAGVGSGTLFHYFGDKRSIMVSIFTDDQQANDALIASFGTEGAAPELWQLLDHLCRDVGEAAAPGLVVAMLELAVSDEVFAELLSRGDDRVRAAFAHLIRATAPGVFPADLDPDRAGRWLLGLVDTLYLMSGDTGFDPVIDTDELFRIAAVYLGGRPPDRRRPQK